MYICETVVMLSSLGFGLCDSAEENGEEKCDGSWLKSDVDSEFQCLL